MLRTIFKDGCPRCLEYLLPARGIPGPLVGEREDQDGMRTVTNGPGEGRRAVIFKILLDSCFRLKSWQSDPP